MDSVAYDSHLIFGLKLVRVSLLNMWIPISKRRHNFALDNTYTGNCNIGLKICLCGRFSAYSLHRDYKKRALRSVRPPICDSPVVATIWISLQGTFSSRGFVTSYFMDVGPKPCLASPSVVACITDCMRCRVMQHLSRFRLNPHLIKPSNLRYRNHVKSIRQHWRSLQHQRGACNHITPRRQRRSSHKTLHPWRSSPRPRLW